jgi:two-component system KDP operon response regulator KdpE
MSEARPAVLVIDDEPDLRQLLRTSLTADGYRVIESATGPRGAIDAGSHKPDVAIIDLALPGMHGLDVIRQIRRWSAMPIIVLSARTQESTKVEALDAGADDYVTKPFSMPELLARVRVAVRHTLRPPGGGTVLTLGDTVVDLDARTATRNAREIRLTPTEFRMLAVLAKHLGMVVTHRQLLREVWGPTHEQDTHYLRIYMKQLRDKLEQSAAAPRHLLTEIGIGYRLVASDTPA